MPYPSHQDPFQVATRLLIPTTARLSRALPNLNSCPVS